MGPLVFSTRAAAPTLWTVTLALMLFGAGCASDPDGSSAPAPEAAGGGDLVVEVVAHDELKGAIRDQDGPVTLVNFWATWCAPCVKEFPDLVQIGKDFASDGVNVVFVSADSDALAPRVETFLHDQGVTGVSYRQDWEDTDFVRGFSDRWNGVLPTTFLFDESGDLIDSWEGARTYDEVAERLREALAS